MRARVAFVVLFALTACKKEDPPPAPTPPPVASVSAAASAQEAPFDRTMFRDSGLGGRRHRIRVNDAGGAEVGD